MHWTKSLSKSEFKKLIQDIFLPIKGKKISQLNN